MDIRAKNRVWKASAVLSAICILVALNVLTLVIWRNTSATECDDTKNFINQRFACGHKDIVSKKEYSELKYRLRAYIRQKEEEGKLSDISIWFRDLEAGPTFGINERKDFIPASLLKLPLAMTYLELAETMPGLLEQEITYGSTAPFPRQSFAPGDPIQKGQQYAIDQLIAHAVIYSDNAAAQLLYEYLLKHYPTSLTETYRDLGIIDPGTELDKAAVNTKEYGAIFRMLYNVSFLDIDMSEKLLDLLVRSEFKQGLMQGIPEQIKVANKFGERYHDNGENQLHDCGIVYYPDNPYQLCVMTRGNNFADLQSIIGDISKMVYEEFDSRKF